MKTFLTQDKVELKNGNHLFHGENPVTNAEFVQAQQQAEYVIKFAELAKGKSFKDVKGYSLSQLRMDVMEALSEKDEVFVEKPTAVDQSLTKKLAEEAMNFMNFQENSNKVDQVNAFMQKFKVLRDFETVGLFFDQGIVKLNKIYTVKEVLDAVNSCTELL